MAAQRAEDTAKLTTGFTHLVDGEPVTSAQWIDVINPATGEVFARCPDADRALLDRAVAAARRAFPEWHATSFEMRRAAVHRMAQALRDHQNSLAELLTLEQGKPLSQAKDEIARAATQSEGMAQIAI